MGGLTSNASFVVTLIDVNDNAPMFDPMSISLTITESAEFGSELTVVSATDLDQAENGFVTYSLNSAEINSTFTIDLITGVISVNRQLDFETRRRYVIIVTGTDGGVPQRSGTLTINLDVLDENDNSPIIQNPMPEFIIDENVETDTLVGQVLATDADSGTNAELVYEIINGNDANRFMIDPASGMITTNGTIDREGQEVYMLSVEVRLHAYSVCVCVLSIEVRYSTAHMRLLCRSFAVSGRHNMITLSWIDVTHNTVCMCALTLCIYRCGTLAHFLEQFRHW